MELRRCSMSTSSNLGKASLIQHAQLRGFLPRRLMVQCDNTSADYKNTNTLRTLGYFVSRGVFDEVTVFSTLGSGGSTGEGAVAEEEKGVGVYTAPPVL